MLRFATAPWFLLLVSLAPAGTLYTTGFENFTPGPDRIAGAPALGIPGTDGWTGSHPGQDRSGIYAEADHALPGVGNAAYIGGNTASILSGNATMFVRKALNVQPWSPPATQEEVVTLRVLIGIKDSGMGMRDNFELVIYNNNTLSGGTGSWPIAGIQFDNSQLNPTTLRPWQNIYRYSYDPAVGGMRYLSTGATFLYDVLQALELRINYRTNRWSATLDSVPLFSDLTFYSGPQSLNLGSVLFRCQASSLFAPGSNYMLFDDLSISMDPLPAAAPPDLTYSPTAGAQLRWTQEAGYGYGLQWSENLTAWQFVSGSPSASPPTTGYTGTLTDPAALSRPRRFYRLRRTDP